MSQPAPPSSGPQLPPLSPPFINADDAARWAHERIGNRRSVAYGGVILKLENRYFATTPIPGSHDQFTHSALLVTGPDGHHICPSGYTGEAYYLSQSQEIAYPSNSPDWTAELFALYQDTFNDAHKKFILTFHDFAPVMYVSTVGGSLVKYRRSGSTKEQTLYTRLLHSEQLGAPTLRDFLQLDIRELADAGEFSIIISSSSWGGARGRVPANWTIGGSLSDRQRVQPFFTPIYEQAMQAVRSAFNLIGSATTRQSGFILKSIRKEAYVATLPLPATEALLTAEGLFAHIDAHIRLPAGYRLYGLYVYARPKPEQLSAKQQWLYPNFFSPAEIAQGIDQARQTLALQDPALGLCMYLHTRDRAILKYRFSGSEPETQLLKARALELKLHAPNNSLTPTRFVQQVASAGELSIEQTSSLWESSGRIDQRWQPYARYQCALMSEVFITADDAARYTHQQVGHQRSHDYVALILQRTDKRFVITHPHTAEHVRFALDAVYPNDAEGAIIVLADDCQLHALFASRATTTARLALHGTEADIAAQMFSDDDIYRLLQQQRQVNLAYLSGSANNLLRFRSAGLVSLAEQELLERVTPADGGSLVAQAWAREEELPSAFVRELAFTSSLSVVVGSPLWGAAGTLPVDWSANPEPKAPYLPERPAVGEMFSSAAQAMLHTQALGLERYKKPEGAFRFILKREGHEEYAITEAVSGAQIQAFHQLCRYDLQLQAAEFGVFAIGYLPPIVARARSGGPGWLSRHFISPVDLTTAFYQDNGERRFDQSRPAALYIATRDDGLLHYTLEAGARPFEQSVTQIQRSLDEARLSTRDFVIEVAQHGTLNVLKGDECWDAPGKVDAHWLPYAHITRRKLSPAFALADDAMRYVRATIKQHPDTVLGGLLLQASNGLYVATEPRQVHVEDFDPQWINLQEQQDRGLFLGASTIVACYHTRSPQEPDFALPDVERAVLDNLYSPAFISAILSAPGTPSRRKDYLLASDGSLLSFSVNEVIGDDQALHDQSATPSAIEKQFRQGQLQPSDWVKQLASFGQLQVVESSALWGPMQHVDKYWQPYANGDAPATTDLPLGPLFTQAEDAVRYIHRHCTTRDTLRYGWVLQSSRTKRYMASLPRPLPDRRYFQREQRLLAPSLAEDFTFIAVYLIAPDVSAQSSWEVQRNFLAPTDLELGMAAALAARTSDVSAVPLYLSCADKALLKLEAFRPAQVLTNAQLALEYFSKMQAGQASTADYIHTIARSGVLKILDTSAYWPATGVVSKQWQPTQTTQLDHPIDNRLALSPIFLHADDAARYSQRLIGRYQGTDYLSVILDNAAGTYVATEPLPDNATPSTTELRLFWTEGQASNSAVYRPLPEFPRGYDIVATHQLYKRDLGPDNDAMENELGNHLISWSEIFHYTRWLKRHAFHIQNYYLSSRDGALLRYKVDRSADSLQNSMIERFNHMSEYKPSALLQALVDSQSLQLVEPGDYWTQNALVKPGWRPLLQAQAEIKQSAPPFHHEKDEF